MLINCPFCNSKKYKIVYKSTLRKSDSNRDVIRENLKNTLGDYTKHGQIVSCLNCNLYYVNPKEDLKFFKEYENVIDPDYLETEKFRKLLSSNHLNIIEKFKKEGKILDVGCFAGFFLELAKEKKWDTFGIEPSKWAKKIAEKKGVRIIGKTLENSKLPDGEFDVITLWDVIEHLPNPNQALKKIYSILKNNGIIAIGTPNIESVTARILRSRNHHLIRMHVVLYGKKSIKKLLKKNGFEIIRFASYGRTYPLIYILNRLAVSFPFLKTVNTLISKNKTLANISINMNLHDEMLIIAKKSNAHNFF